MSVKYFFQLLVLLLVSMGFSSTGDARDLFLEQGIKYPSTEERRITDAINQFPISHHTFDTKTSTKAHGADFTIGYPDEWVITPEEGFASGVASFTDPEAPLVVRVSILTTESSVQAISEIQKEGLTPQRMAKLLPSSATIFNARTIAGTHTFGLMNYKMPINYKDSNWLIYGYRKIFFTNGTLAIVQFTVAGPPAVEDDIKWYADKYRPLFGAMAESIAFPNPAVISPQHSWWDERCDASCDTYIGIGRWIVIACLIGLINKVRKKKEKNSNK